MAEFHLASYRYVELVNELGREREFKHGWKKQVAELLGIHVSYLSKLVSEPGRTVSIRAVSDAASRLKISLDYFRSSSGAYRKYLLQEENKKPSYEELASAFRRAVAHLDYCGYGDNWERECAGELPQRFEELIERLDAAGYVGKEKVIA